MRRSVLGPDGRRWEVRRRWITRLRTRRLRERLRRRMRGDGATSDVGEALAHGADVFGETIIGAIVGLIALLLLAFVLLPLLVSFVDVLLLVVIAGVGLVARLLGWRPWAIDAIASDGTEHEWRVNGLRASRERVDQIASAIAHDLPLPGPPA